MNVDQKYIIYALIDPRNSEVRYVGKSATGMTRPKVHFCPSSLRPGRSGNLTKKQAWIKSLLNQIIVPRIMVLEALESRDDLDESEVFWIGYFRFLGARLTNGTTGGDGYKGGVPWNKGLKDDPRLGGGRKLGGIPWNKGLKGSQAAWNKGLKGVQVAWNKGLKMTANGELSK